MKRLEIIKGDEKAEIYFSGRPLLSSVLEKAGFPIDSPCGGKGKCGKCALEVFGEVSAPTDEEIKHKTRLACKTRLFGDAKAILPETYGISVSVESRTPEMPSCNADFNYGAVLDIGTTTLALKIFSGDGRVLAESVSANPQRSVASDVIGRIEASLKGEAQKLKLQISKAVNDLLSDACEKAKIDASQIEKTVIVGNTAMLYLLCGINPESIARAPFEADNLFDINIKDPVKAYLPPCINAFVGADLVCAVLASGMCEKNETALLCDIGTNGEIALWKEGRLYVTSAAAGPAFEGAEISCGCPSMDGAVHRVALENGKITAYTVNNAPAAGICGSGLIDAVAIFLELGYIDASGVSPTELNLPTKGRRVYITNDDIRALQLAKSAVRSAVDTLLDITKTNAHDLSRLYLSGGFGNNLNLDSAMKIGLIPKELLPRTELIGNGALTGGGMLLLDPEAEAAARKIAFNAIHVELGGNPRFNESFIKNLNF